MQLSSVKAVQALYSALGGLRKAGKAHIRMRVINAFEPVAQSVEHVTFNHGVQGSNPCGLTMFIVTSNIFNYLEAALSNLGGRLDNFCSRFMP